MAVMLFSGGWLFLKVMEINFSFRSKGDARCFRFYMALGGGMLLTGLSQGKMLFIFPTNLFWCLFFGMAYAVYRIHVLAIEDAQNEIHDSRSFDEISQESKASLPEQR